MWLQVKPLGVLAMIDDGELDWKIIAINAEDPKASSVNDIEDVERYGPPYLQHHDLLCITCLNDPAAEQLYFWVFLGCHYNAKGRHVWHLVCMVGSRQTHQIHSCNRIA